MIDWKRTAARMRGDLDRADVTGRARRLAEFAIKATLMRGRTRVVIPKRADLCRLLKIGANHVAEVVAELDAAGIVQVKALDEGWELLVFPDFGGWRCKWLYMREELGEFLTALERAPGQAQGELIEPEPCLAKALSETSAENVSTSHFGNSRPAGLPILGTPCASRASVSCEASIEQLNGEQLSPTLIPTVKERRLQLSAAQEHEAMNRLRSFVGEADVQQWGGDWRKNWLRADPEKFLAALDTLIAEEKAGMFTARKSKGAALKDLIRRWA
jgi:hypothetical protein